MEKRHQSIWTETQCPRPTYPILKGSCHCDVAIVGAGITGLTTAYELKKAGVSVIVLEAETLGGGTTGRTSGHLSSLWDRCYSTVLTKHGLDKATTIYRALQSAIDDIESVQRMKKAPFHPSRTTSRSGFRVLISNRRGRPSCMSLRMVCLL